MEVIKVSIENINQQAKRIEECCNRIMTANPSDEVRQQVNEIKDCCKNIEKNI